MEQNKELNKQLKYKKMIKIELEEWQVRKLREYFRYNSKTQTSHWAFKVFDKAFEDHHIKEPLEYGRWVVNDNHPNWMAMFDKENKLFYGLNSNGDWFCYELDNSNPNANKEYQYATNEEILSKLSKMALKMGFKKGCSFELDDFLWGRSYGGKRGTNHLDSEPIFKYEDNTLYIIKGYNCLVIMKGGKWAKIIKQEPTTIESLEKRIAALESKLK